MWVVKVFKPQLPIDALTEKVEWRRVASFAR